MDKVNSFNTSERLIDGDAALTYIDDCYARLEALPGFSVRPGQLDLSKSVCRAMVAGEPLAAEAPTGTGKTLAYLIGALAASERMVIGKGENAKPAPIVIATATVGLQSQVIQGDIPALVSAGILQADEAVIAKGRGRYFCIQSAVRAQRDSHAEGQYDFFDQEANFDMEANLEINQMLELHEAQAWNGDIDSYADNKPISWPIVAASSNTCVGQRQCEYSDDCPFFRARMQLSGRRIIVGNHDFILADLKMGLEKDDTVLPFKNYLLVFDEAHHLPDKAMDFGVSELSLSAFAEELPKMTAFGKTWPRNPDIASLFKYAKLSAPQFDISSLTNAINAVTYELKGLSYESETLQHRFSRGQVPVPVLKAAQLALEHLTSFNFAMSEANKALKTFKIEGKRDDVIKTFRELLYSSASILGRLSGASAALSGFVNPERMVRWAFYSPKSDEPGSVETLSIHISPLDGTRILRELLWNNTRVRTAMVSATIRDLKGFDRFKAKLGVTDVLRTMELAPIFPYRENSLLIVDMKSSPRNDEREAFTKELALNLVQHISADEATLILFSSRKMMREVLPSLRHKFGYAVMAQEDKGISELLQDHRNRIDEGLGSVLCGLATMAEGLDLPGKYCTHVVITSIPFAVPTSPVERELAELLGSRNFLERSVPEALTKLTQMVGRLMRRETDRGKITIYDKRLLYSQWGRQMLEALPNFRKKAIASLGRPKPTYPKPTAPTTGFESSEESTAPLETESVSLERRAEESAKKKPNIRLVA